MRENESQILKKMVFMYWCRYSIVYCQIVIVGQQSFAMSGPVRKVEVIRFGVPLKKIQNSTGFIALLSSFRQFKFKFKRNCTNCTDAMKSLQQNQKCSSSTQ